MKLSWRIGLLVAVFANFAVLSFVWNQNQTTSSSQLLVFRSVANEDQSQQKIIDLFTEKIVAMKTVDDVTQTMEEIVEEAKSHPQKVVVQIFADAAALAPLLRGLLWRLRGIVEKTDIAHLTVLNQLRQFSFSRYTYGPHITAVFNYLTLPPDDSLVFNKISELQEILYTHIKPKLMRLFNRAQNALLLPADRFRVKIDRKLLLGEDESKRYLDPEEAEREFIKPYMHFIVSGLARTIGTIDYTYCYDFDDTPKIMNAMLKKSAINAVLGRFKTRFLTTKSLPKVMTRKHIIAEIKKRPKFLRARFSQKKTNTILDESFKMFSQSAHSDLDGYVCTISHVKEIVSDQDHGLGCDSSFTEQEGFSEEEYFIVGGKYFLVDPNQLLINYRQKFHELLERKKVYGQAKNNGNTTIISDVTGEPVVINARAAFRYHKSLQIFLPIEFNSEQTLNGITFPANKVGVYNQADKWAWNYDYGMPTGWKTSAVTFGGIFPNATNDNIYDIMRNVMLTRSLKPFGFVFTTMP